jgi:hypothetical protein
MGVGRVTRVWLAVLLGHWRNTLPATLMAKLRTGISETQALLVAVILTDMSQNVALVGARR